MAQGITDEEFASRLRQFTGSDDVWEDHEGEFYYQDPECETYGDDEAYGEDEVYPPEADPEEDGGASVDDAYPIDFKSSLPDMAPNEDGEIPTRAVVISEEEYAKEVADDSWQSDDPSGMILNVRHLDIGPKDIDIRVHKSSKRKIITRNGTREAVLDLRLHSEHITTSDEALADEAVASTEDEVHLKVGELSLNGESFTPWKVLRQYPYTYVGNRNRSRCEPFFTAQELCRDRSWEFYYIYPPEGGNGKPYLFVPTSQFQDFLNAINVQLDTDFTIPDGTGTERFSICFGDKGTPRPRFLGISTDFETFEHLSTNVPAYDPADSLEHSSDSIRTNFLSRLDMINKSTKNSGKSEKNRKKRIKNHRDWGQSLKRVQRYLGFRRKLEYRNDFTPNSLPLPLNLDVPVLNKMDSSVVFLAIDIEAYEFNQDIITEVGLVTLDTKALVNIAPGEGARNWFPKIRARHLRIRENLWAQNRRHVRGCADRFMFGEFVKLSDVVEIIEEIMDVRNSNGGLRNVVLVFHDASQDLAYLDKLGCSMDFFENILETVDTRNMHQFIARGQNPTKLETVLDSLGIPWQHLHNAGNDALYTMRAMVALALKSRTERLARAIRDQEAEEDLIKFSPTEPTFGPADKQEAEGWTSGGEDTDGGLAPKLRDHW